MLEGFMHNTEFIANEEIAQVLTCKMVATDLQ